MGALLAVLPATQDRLRIGLADRDHATFTPCGGKACIREQMGVLANDYETASNKALDDFLAGTATQCGRQRFDVPIRTVAGKAQDFGLGRAEFDWGGHVRFLEVVEDKHMNALRQQ